MQHLGSNGCAEAPPGKPDQFEAEVIGRVDVLVQHHIGLDHLPRNRVGNSDDARLDDGGVLHEDRLDLERTDQMPGRLDDVITTPDKPEIAFLVAASQISADIPAGGEAGLVALGLPEVATEHRWPARPKGEHAVGATRGLHRHTIRTEDDLLLLVRARGSLPPRPAWAYPWSRDGSSPLRSWRS